MKNAIELLQKELDTTIEEYKEQYDTEELQYELEEASGIEFDAGFQFGLEYAIRMLKVENKNHETK